MFPDDEYFPGTLSTQRALKVYVVKSLQEKIFTVAN